MPSVTVDLEDLEALVFAAGVIKQIEAALSARKSDPFVVPYLKLTEAHDRCAEAVRFARRSENQDVATKWDDPLTKAEAAFLKGLQPGYWVTPEQRVAPPGEEGHPEIDTLMCKGHVVIGHFVTGISWSGKPPELMIDPKGFPVKITPRGLAKLEELRKSQGAK